MFYDMLINKINFIVSNGYQLELIKIKLYS